MNIVGLFILGALVLDYVVGLAATVLNLKSLDQKLPLAFANFFDDEAYAKSQEYTRTKTRFDVLAGSFGLGTLLLFWFLGGFALVDNWTRAVGFGPIITGILFIMILLMGQSLLSLPFSIYSTFRIESRFGFNKTTPRTFVLDRVKGLGLGIVIGGPILGAVIAFFSYAGPLGWLYCWILITAFSITMQYLAPTLIMPLFNKFEPLAEGELRNRILSYADRVEFPLRNVFVMDGSKRSSKGNAFFTGFGRNKRVVLLDTLVDRHDEEEIVAVIAHEVGHYKKRHIIQGLVMSILHTGFTLFLLSLVLSSPALFEAFFVTQPSVHAGLVFFGLLFSPVELALSVAVNALSRKNEFEADHFAVTTTGDRQALAEGLKRLSKDSLSNLTPHPFYVWLHYSHPPLARRISAILAIPV